MAVVINQLTPSYLSSRHHTEKIEKAEIELTYDDATVVFDIKRYSLQYKGYVYHIIDKEPIKGYDKYIYSFYIRDVIYLEVNDKHIKIKVQ